MLDDIYSSKSPVGFILPEKLEIRFGESLPKIHFFQVSQHFFSSQCNNLFEQKWSSSSRTQQIKLPQTLCLQHWLIVCWTFQTNCFSHVDFQKVIYIYAYSVIIALKTLFRWFRIYVFQCSSRDPWSRFSKINFIKQSSWAFQEVIGQCCQEWFQSHCSFLLLHSPLTSLWLRLRLVFLLATGFMELTLFIAWFVSWLFNWLLLDVKLSLLLWCWQSSTAYHSGSSWFMLFTILCKYSY